MNYYMDNDGNIIRGNIGADGWREITEAEAKQIIKDKRIKSRETRIYSFVEAEARKITGISITAGKAEGIKRKADRARNGGKNQKDIESEDKYYSFVDILQGVADEAAAHDDYKSVVKSLLAERLNEYI